MTLLLSTLASDKFGWAQFSMLEVFDRQFMECGVYSELEIDRAQVATSNTGTRRSFFLHSS